MSCENARLAPLAARSFVHHIKLLP